VKKTSHEPAFLREEREESRDDVSQKGKESFFEVNLVSYTGKVWSLRDGAEYKIDGRELARAKTGLMPGTRPFAPIEVPEEMITQGSSG